VEPVALDRIDATVSTHAAGRAQASLAARGVAFTKAWYRRAATAFMFATFGLGALAIACVAFPIIARRRSGDRTLVAQQLIHRSFARFERLGDVLGLFEVHDTHADRLAAAPGLVVANHPSLLDVVFLIARMPQADCIVKLGAWRNPFLRRIVSIAGYIANDEGPAVIDACVERLRAGRALVVFPEGTRSPMRGLRTFKRGAARVALRSQAVVTPVAIRCEPPALGKRQRWWGMGVRKIVYTLEVGTAFRATGPDAGDHAESPREARRITAMLQEYFQARGVDAGDR
jgi:1-acyl-sn-glycerol-3-phosphate acyltransferase